MSNSQGQLDVVFKSQDAIKLAEWVGSDVYKILEKYYLPQREIIIGRIALEAPDEKSLWFAKGQREEARRFFKILEDLKKQIKARDAE